MVKIRELLGTFGDAASIASLFGISMIAVVSALSGFWAHIEKLRTSYILIISLIVFVSLIWSWIGLVWIFDRAKQSRSAKRPTLECPWGIILENSVIRIDPIGDFNGQIAVQIKNTYSFPIRVDVITSSVSIENLLPDQVIDEAGPFIVMPGPSITFSYPAFSKGRLPDKDRLKGKFEISLRYGHPDGDYSRVMSRWMQFDQVVRPSFPQGLFAGTSVPVLPMANQIPLTAGPYKEDEDKPYIPPKS